MKWWSRRRGSGIVINSSIGGSNDDRTEPLDAMGTDGIMIDSQPSQKRSTTTATMNNSNNNNNNNSNNISSSSASSSHIITTISSFLSKLLPCFSESFIQRIIWVFVWGWKVAPVALYESFRKDYYNDGEEGQQRDDGEGPSSSSSSSPSNFHKYVSTWWKKTIVVPTAIGFYYFMYDQIAQPLVYSLGCCRSDIVTFLAQISILAGHFTSGLAMHLCEERRRRQRQQQIRNQQEEQEQDTAATAAEAAEFERRFHETTTGNRSSGSSSQYHLHHNNFGRNDRHTTTTTSTSGGRRFWPRLFGGRKTEEDSIANRKNHDDKININTTGAIV